jgi:hypothetical protein
MNIVLSALALLAANSAFAAECSKLPQTYYVRAIDRFNVGEATRTDVAEAQVSYIQAQLECSAMEKTQYCYEASIAVETLVEGMKQEASVGQRKDSEVYAAEVKSENIVKFCSQK